MKRKQKGFTLIELLVVISIISLLASIVLTSVNSARVKARDAKRRGDLKQLSTALNLYYAKYETFPVSTPVCNPGQNVYGDYWCRDSTDNNGTTPITNWIPGLQEFVGKLPQNPKPYGTPAGTYHYYSPSPTKYFLFVMLEGTNQPGTCGAGASIIFNGVNYCTVWGSLPNMYGLMEQ
jgi:prepilin-type N-terminal cleavage/methylation domain-containing protein